MISNWGRSQRGSAPERVTKRFWLSCFRTSAGLLFGFGGTAHGRRVSGIEAAIQWGANEIKFRMSERQKQINFLKVLIRHEESEQHRDLQDRIKKAEQDEKCIRRMLFLVFVVELLSLAGLGYSAVFHPNFFAYTTPFLVRLFSALGLGSLVCLVAFLGYWLWHRNMLNDLNEECRRVVLASLHPHSQPSYAAANFISNREPHLTVYQRATSDVEEETSTISLRQAS